MVGPGEVVALRGNYRRLMESATRPPRLLAEIAALARIEEIGDQMSTYDAIDTAPPKAVIRELWAAGDYHRFAKTLVWEVGPVLVEACGISAGQRVLDVAAGTGNVAIRAAETGASVVASDLTPENFAAGKSEALARGVELEWVQADAEALPFGDAEFDVVTSSFGAMFAPDQQRVADELIRVCRPGGTIGLANFTPEGHGGEFFTLLAKYLPPPPTGARSPLLWGDEEHVRGLFGDRVESLRMTRETYVEHATTPTAYCELFNQTFGPIVMLRASLGERTADFDHEFLRYASRSNRSAPGTAAEYEYEYLLVIARKSRT